MKKNLFLILVLSSFITEVQSQTIDVTENSIEIRNINDQNASTLDNSKYSFENYDLSSSNFNPFKSWGFVLKLVGGWNLSLLHIYDSASYKNYLPFSGYRLGFSSDVLHNSGTYIASGLYLNKKGFKLTEGSFETDDVADRVLSINYLQIPVSIGFQDYLGYKTYQSFEVGIYFDIGINGKIRSPKENQTYQIKLQDVSYKNGITKFDYGLNASFDYTKGNFVFEILSQYSLKHLSLTNIPLENGENRNLEMSGAIFLINFSIGYKF